mgnify:CR=1 FL=1
MKIFIVTFGCKVNQYESQAIWEKFARVGWTKAASVRDADVVVVNSCTVTEESDRKVKKALHKIRKENSGAVVVLTGCMPQAFSARSGFIETVKDADIVLGNVCKYDIFAHVREFLKTKNKIVAVKAFDVRNPKFESAIISDFSERTRAFLKIEDGCNNFCSYCIIPYARGRVRSKPIDEIFAEVKNLAQKGYKEVVLVGINLSAYGKDIGLTLCDAVEMACSVDGIERVRLGSLEPDQMDEAAILRLSAQKKLCPQFHLSLQSGCDATLKRMNRTYTAEDYYLVVKRLRENFENAAITTDVMVGFAGETDEEFEESLSFVKKVGFAKVHVFAYSKRAGTRAAEFANQVDPAVKKSRSKAMIAATNSARREFFNSQIEKTETVLYETRDSKGFWHGHTRNYTPVVAKAATVAPGLDLHSKIVLTKLIKSESDYCVGELIEN